MDRLNPITKDNIFEVKERYADIIDRRMAMHPIYIPIPKGWMEMVYPRRPFLFR